MFTAQGNFLVLVTAVFDRLRNVLHEGTIDVRTQYMVEVMFAVRKDGFKVIIIGFLLKYVGNYFVE